MNSKINHGHLDRRAVVYLRQSTMKQVYEHRESALRQYGLRERAIDLGWPAEAVDIIDEDQGQSGGNAHERTGFQRLARDVAHGKVGAIFAIEVSRLARSSADWHQLIRLCRLAGVIIADEQAIYAPSDHNDLLLLGIKGTMAEAELGWLRLRLQGALMSKARRGELRIPPPTGYQWDEQTQRFRFDPDEAVQRALSLVFERFRVEGSAQGVGRYFTVHDLQLPARQNTTGAIRWVLPKPEAIVKILHNPLYAGAYVYGRRRVRTELVDGQVRQHHGIRVPQEAWTVCLKDRHPGYIDWEEYMANQGKLDQNRSNHQEPEQRGAAREGAALLQGLVICGRCGQRMRVEYPKDAQHGRYCCRSSRERGGKHEDCWSVGAPAVDEAVRDLFLQAAQPPEIELALAVAKEAERQAAELDRQWKLRIERVRYEARLAERRYKAIDPDNRVVARTLEREWEEKLRDLEETLGGYEEARRREKVELTDADRARVLALARDLPRVWRSPSTTQAQRKTLLRTLVREVTLTPVGRPARGTRIQALWETGAVSDFTVENPGPGKWSATAMEVKEQVRQGLLEGQTPGAIASELNDSGILTGAGNSWTADAVNTLAGRYRLRPSGWIPPNVPVPERRADGAYSLTGLAVRFGVSRLVVRYWVRKGVVRPTDGGGKGNALWFDLDEVTLARIARVLDRRPPRKNTTPIC